MLLGRPSYLQLDDASMKYSCRFDTDLHSRVFPGSDWAFYTNLHFSVISDHLINKNVYYALNPIQKVLKIVSVKSNKC